MSTSGASGIAITDVSTTAQAPLGSLAYEPATSVGSNADMGEQVWIYVYNDPTTTAQAWVAGDVILRDTAVANVITSTYDGTRSETQGAPAHLVLGVAQHAIASGSYGYILRKGIAAMTGDGSVADGDPIVSHTGGLVDTMAAGEEHCVFGVALADDAPAVTCLVNCIG
jgi:hypothetical protein